MTAIYSTTRDHVRNTATDKNSESSVAYQSRSSDQPQQWDCLCCRRSVWHGSWW